MIIGRTNIRQMKKEKLKKNDKNRKKTISNGHFVNTNKKGKHRERKTKATKKSE
jgi:hypothetical protein